MDLNRAMVNLYKQKSSACKDKGPTNRKSNNQGLDLQVIEDEDPIDAVKKRPRLMTDLISSFDEQPTTTFDQLFGIEQAKLETIEIVERFKRSVENRDVKSRWPYLICGSHGLGKTAIVEAAANHVGYKLIVAPLKTLVRKSREEYRWVLQQIIGHCLKHQTAILLIDDLNQIGEKDDLKYQVHDTIETISLSENKVLIICTSLTPHDITGIEFHPSIYLKRPDLGARLQILQSFARKSTNLKNLTDESIKELALNTPSFTALDLEKMIDKTRDKAEYPQLRDFQMIVELIRQSFMRGTHLIGERPSITWSDIGGMHEVQDTFSEIREELRRDDLNVKFSGIALYGPPGCGKTMVAQAMANEAGLNFICVNPSDLINKFLGETERNIRRVFSEAREYEPCIIYFDEFDGLCGTRGNKDNMTGAIQTLLSEMDGFASRGKSIVLVSTNRLDDIDPAMKRPGRLSKHIYVGPPDRKARRDIILVKLRSYGLTTPVATLDLWSDSTEGMTGAEIDSLVYEAKMEASRDSKSNGTNKNDQYNVKDIRDNHFDIAFKKLQRNNEELRRRISIKL